MKLLFTSLLFTISCFVCAQPILECSGRDQHAIYFVSPGNGIYRIDSVDTSPTEPILVLGEPQTGADGLSINRLLDTVPNPLSLYCTSNGYYHFWDGSQWVKTNHMAGGFTGNVGGTDSFIFCLVPATGTVYRYDGKTHATALVSLPINGSATAFDVATDRLGNFYIFYTDSSRIVVYNPKGYPMDTFTTSGHASGAQGGLALLNSRMYLIKLNSLYEGKINGHHVTFSLIKTYSTNLGLTDIASCPEAASPIGVAANAMPLEFVMFPNPVNASSVLYLNTSLHNAEIIITDMHGKVILHKTLSGNKIEIDRNQVKNGIYLITIKDGTRQCTKTVVVE